MNKITKKVANKSNYRSNKQSKKQIINKANEPSNKENKL